MSKFTYESANISSAGTLYNALINNGVTDAIILLNDHLDITTEIGTQEQCDAAVADATIGSLYSNQSQMVEQVRAKSQVLISKGVDDWSGRKVELSKNEADNYYTDFEYFSSNPSKLTVDTPYIISGLSGGISVTSDINDIKTLSDNSVDRLQYIYTARVNQDGSKGEISIVSDIFACTTQGELDLISDTRQ